MTEVKVQRALNAQKEANARLASLPKRDLHAAPEDLKALEELQRTNDGMLRKRRTPARQWAMR